MKGIVPDSKVIAIAAGLHLSLADPIESILDFCRKRVKKILKHARSFQSIWDVEKIVCDHLNLVVHEIWNNDELRALSERYAADEADPKFGALEMELEGDDAFGVLYQRNIRNEAGEFQYVAFVDCRGEKSLRRFFTRWHEIAHCLTTFEQFEMPFRRVSAVEIEKEPVERLMDMIAGELGFLDSLFLPVLESEIGEGRLTFDVVERIRSRFCPDASFQATLNACAARLDQPVVIVEAGMTFKAHEKRLLQRLGDDLPKASRPKPSLRVLRSMPNTPARELGLLIHKQRRVPDTSAIAVACASGEGDTHEGIENLNTWVASDGSSLGDFDVFVQARKIRDHVFAIVSTYRKR